MQGAPGLGLFFLNNNFIHLFMAMPGLHAAWALLWLQRAGAPFSL